MTWKKFQEESFDLTRAEVESYIPDIIKQYQEAKKSIDSMIRAQYDKYLNAVGTENYYNEMIKYDRLLNLEKQIYSEYVYYSKNAEKYIKGALQTGFSNQYYLSAYTTAWLAPTAKIGLLPPALIELATLGTASSWKSITKAVTEKYGPASLYKPQYGTLSDLLYKNRMAELTKISETITQSLVRGQSYTQTSRALADIIGISTTTDGIKNFSGAMANAMRILDTESTRVMNDAAFANTMNLQSQGINVKKIWIATKDTKTRPEHARLDGIIKEVDKYFFIGSDKALKPGGFSQVKNVVNCRCAMGDIIDDKAPSLMRGRDPVTGENEVLNYSNYMQWAEDKGINVEPVRVIIR